MNNGAKEILIALGATSEVLGIFRDQLITNGFTREEAIDLCKTCLSTILTKNTEEKSNDGT